MKKTTIQLTRPWRFVVTLFAVLALSVGQMRAETEVTVYCAIPASELKTNEVLKVNANIGDNNTWRQSTMTNTGKTYNGKLIYSGTFYEKWGGVDALQFQIYEGSTWKRQKQPYSSWTTTDKFGGKMFVYDSESWVAYHYDVTVTFNANGHGTVPDAQTILDGQAATEPSDPTASGWEFGGWYENAACTGSEWDFSTTLTADKELFAKWTEIQGGSVVLSAGTGGKVSKDNTNWGSSATITDIIENQEVAIYAKADEGYTFQTWTKTAGTGSIKTNAAAGVYNAVASSAEAVKASFNETMSKLTVSLTAPEGAPAISDPTASAESIGIATTATVTAAIVPIGYQLTGWTLTNCVRTDEGAAAATEITVRSNGDGAVAEVVANYAEDLTTTWTMKGDFADVWQTIYYFLKPTGESTGNVAYTTLNLSGNKTYEFKVIAGGTDWKGNAGTMTIDNCTDWEFTSNEGSNCHLTTTVTGQYTFKIDFSDEAKPKLSVVYPIGAPAVAISTFSEVSYAVNTTQLFLSGYVTDDGLGGAVATKLDSVGFVINGKKYPMTCKDGEDKAYFWGFITDLEPGTTYSVKAFADNSAGQALSEAAEFTTRAASKCIIKVQTGVDEPSPKIYAFSGDDVCCGKRVENNTWPGVSMGEPVIIGQKHKWYAYELSNEYNMFVICQGETPEATVATQTNAIINTFANNCFWYWPEGPTQQERWGEIACPYTTPQLMIGHEPGNTDNMDYHEMAAEAGKLTKTVALLANSSYKFKPVYGAEWYGKTALTTLTRAAATATALEADDGTDLWIETDFAGDYKFTFDPSTQSVTVTYPEAYILAWDANAEGVELTGEYTQGLTKVGDAITKPNDPSRTGYTFAGWAESAEGAVVEVPATMPNAAKTYYAKWNVKTYTVTLNTNGGTNYGEKIESYTYGVGATLPINVLNWANRFDGWYDNEGLEGEPVTAIAADATGNKEFWAKWTGIASSYTVSDRPEFATLEAGDIIVVTVTEAKPNSGAEIYLYEFHGEWSSTHRQSISAPGKYAFELTAAQAEDFHKGVYVTGTNYTRSNVQVLYKKALWEGHVRATITTTGWAQSDDMAEGLFDGLAEGDILGLHISAIDNESDWHHYSLRGRTDWEHTENVVEGSASAVATCFNVLTAEQAATLRDPEKKVDITAQYVDISGLYTYVTTRAYAVTLHANEGTINAGNVENYVYGVGATLPTDVTKTGYTFGGWYANAELTGDAVTEISASDFGAKEYWAKWTANTYTVTLNANGGSIASAQNVTSYTYGVGATLPTHVTHWGDRFEGWYDNVGLEGDPIAEITTTDTGNKEYWAKLTSLVVEISASARPEFKPLAEGDIVVVNVTNVQPNSGAKLVLYGRTSWGITHQKEISAPGKYVFDLTAEQAEDFHAGIGFTGYNYTLADVQVFYRKNVWDTGIDGREAWNQANLSKTLFNGLTTGDLLAVKVDALKEGETYWDYQIQANNELFITQSLTAADTYYHELTAEQVATLQDPLQPIKIGSGCVSVSEIVTYTATKSYIITWLDDDDSLIDKTEVAYGEMPIHGVPEKEATAQYTYAFDTWTPSVVAVTGDATYKAVYTAMVRTYTVTVVNDSVGFGTTDLASVENVPYGTLFVIEEGTPNILSVGAITDIKAIPAEETSQYKYEFKAWTDVPASVTGNVTIHVGFIRTAKSPATAIDNTDAELKAVKFIRDNKIYIRVNGMIFDANGQRVE